MASSIPQAREGQLYRMIVGDRQAFEETRPLLEVLSCSTWGRWARRAWLNLVMNINPAALLERLALDDALGLDLFMLQQVFFRTRVNSRVLQADGEDGQRREHSVVFSAGRAAKHSGLTPGRFCPSPRPPGSSTGAWSSTGSESWTSPASPS